MISPANRQTCRHIRLFIFLLLAWISVEGRRAHAEVGLIVEGPTGGAGFFDDMGHAALWISRGCLNSQGLVYFCEGTPGVVVAGTGYWARTGAAAIPARLYFVGSREGDRRATWNAEMAAIYPNEPPVYGQKYMGRLEGRRTRVDVFPTTPEQDRAAIDRINTVRDEFHFRLIRENCSNLARGLLRLWLGPDFRVRQWTNVSIVTPLAVEEALKERLNEIPGAWLKTYYFPPPRQWRWQRSARDVCSAVLLDPKYAVPMGLLQPEAYVGFGGCYGIVHLKTHFQTRTLRQNSADEAHVDKGATAAETFLAMTSSDRPSMVLTGNVSAAPLSSQGDESTERPQWLCYRRLDRRRKGSAAERAC